MEVKLLLHGPPRSGRRTNYRHLVETTAGRAPRGFGRSVGLAHMELDLGEIGRHRVRVRSVCLPEDSGPSRVRKVVLRGIDGVVFVADSERSRGLDNIVALEELRSNLIGAGRPLDSLPMVYQWNKRDIRSPLPLSVLERDLNPNGSDSVPAIASSGIGVWRTWRRVVERAIEGVIRPRGEGVAHG